MSYPSEGGNKLLHLKTKRRAVGGEGQPLRSVDGAYCAAAPWEAMHLDVFGEVVTPRELLLAHGTLVRLHTRVRSPVP